MSMQDRPARPGRTKPVPAADSGVDPIDYKPATQQPAPAPATSTSTTAPDEGKGATAPAAAAQPSNPTPPASVVPELDVTVQSGIRWSPATEAIVRAAKARTGKTRRALVEEAIARVWGD
ncbi:MULTISPECIES: hypothetical protein [unclassified Microbacterium]|uniref:hypothetical protein n=1 Tax=unclassified Microbacterium TaxID=2609290 RepID=UPI001E54714A|nr:MULTISPECIES: hypothetical protein [unclassified Microbacterium]MCT1377757.1 hypothetical protein [Microbacterium sp. p3-SID337]